MIGEDDYDEILEEGLKKAKDATLEGIRRGFSIGGQAIRDEAANLAPFDTGNLRGSLSYSVFKDGEDGLILEVGTNVEYAPHQEFGTFTKDGKEWVPAHPFLRPAFEGNIEYLKRQIEKAVRDEIGKLKG